MSYLRSGHFSNRADGVAALRTRRLGARLFSIALVMTVVVSLVAVAPASARAQDATMMDDSAEIVGADIVRTDVVATELVLPDTPNVGAYRARSAAAPTCSAALVPSVSASNSVTVSGSVTWATANGTRLPAAFTEVCLFDGGGAIVGRSVTGRDGKFATRVPKGRRGVYAVAYTSSGDAVGSGAASVVVKNADTSPVEPHWVRSARSVDTTTGTSQSLEVLASTNTLENEAFSVYQAMIRGFYSFRDALPTGRGLDTLRVFYPPPPDHQRTSYYPKSKAITVLSEDVWDWDVLHHELAHHVGVATGLQSMLPYEVDRSHAFEANLTATGSNRTVEQSMSLAWVEGWATYAAVSMQQRLKASDPTLSAVRGFGDFRYEDNSSGATGTPSLSFSLITDDLQPSNGRLPDNEMIVARMLQSLDPYDAGAPSPAPLPWPVHDLVAAAKSGAVSDAFDAWNRLDQANPRARLDSCQTENFGMVPRLISVPITSRDQAPTITAWPNGIGPRYGNTTVTATFFDRSNNLLKKFSAEVPTSARFSDPIQIKVPASDWADLKRRGVESWELSGQQPGSLSKYQLRGCRREITNKPFAGLSVKPVCRGGTGAIDGALTNTGSAVADYRITATSASDIYAAPVVFVRRVAPGVAATIALDGLEDGTYIVTVVDTKDPTPSGVLSRTDAKVDCQGLPRTFKRNVSCMSLDGRLDVETTNTGSKSALYTIRIDDSFTRTRIMNSRTTNRFVIPGLKEGGHSLRIERRQKLDDGTFGLSQTVTDENFFVACDASLFGSSPIDVLSWCENGRGQISIYARNDDVAGSDFVAATRGNSRKVEAFAPAGGTALMAFTGIGNGNRTFIVQRNGIEIARPQVTITCS